MSYSALQAPTDLFSVNSALRARAFPLGGDHRRDSDSHSPTMSEPRSPLFRPSLTAEFPSHLASLYNSPYAAAAVAAAVAGQGSASVGAPPTFNPYGRPPSTAAFYSGMVSGDAWRRSPYLPQLDFCWPPGLRSLEAVVGPRTKAPREATTILKSWLNEHKDNPYPTKSEKMTLSLVTHMTLTQVSTWFANARRRIKKENKMTWTPKTRCGERDGSSSNEDENEKDYFGRQRSPFAMSRDLEGNDAKRNSGDYDGNKRSMSFDSSAPSSSVPFAANLTRKGPTHPLFAAFSGLQSPYRGLNTSAIEDVFRQKVISKQDSKNEEKKTPGYSVAERSCSPASSNDAQKYDPRRSPSEVFSPRPSYLTTTEKPPQGESHTPFVKFKKSQHFIDNDSNGIDLTEADKEQSSDECTIAKKDERNVSEPFPVANKHDVPKSEEVSSDKESNRHKSDGEWPLLQQNAAQALHRPFYVNEMMAKSATNGKMDPLSCWIRDFQHLVSSGQEIKAKQALATALAVAAKAGAYSGMGGVKRPAPYYIPRRQSHTERRLSSDGSQSEDSHHDTRRLSGSSIRTSRMSLAGGSQYESRTDSDFKSSSPNLARQRTPPAKSPPANAVRLRSPYKGALAVSDDSPINLSKPSQGKTDWIPTNVTAENERVEA